MARLGIIREKKPALEKFNMEDKLWYVEKLKGTIARVTDKKPLRMLEDSVPTTDVNRLSRAVANYNEAVQKYRQDMRSPEPHTFSYYFQ